MVMSALQERLWEKFRLSNFYWNTIPSNKPTENIDLLIATKAFNDRKKFHWLGKITSFHTASPLSCHWV